MRCVGRNPTLLADPCTFRTSWAMVLKTGARSQQASKAEVAIVSFLLRKGIMELQKVSWKPLEASGICCQWYLIVFPFSRIRASSTTSMWIKATGESFWAWLKHVGVSNTSQQINGITQPTLFDEENLLQFRWFVSHSMAQAPIQRSNVETCRQVTAGLDATPVRSSLAGMCWSPIRRRGRILSGETENVDPRCDVYVDDSIDIQYVHCVNICKHLYYIDPSIYPDRQMRVSYVAGSYVAGLRANKYYSREVGGFLLSLFDGSPEHRFSQDGKTVIAPRVLHVFLV